MITHEPWNLNIAICPADVDFANLVLQHPAWEYIFHMGPGAHHYVGIALCNEQQDRVVTSVTNSPEEHLTYVELVKHRPELAQRYLNLFADIYALDFTQLRPWYDVIYLPHLGEAPDPRRDEYAIHDDLSILDWAISRLSYTGHLVTYNKSSAYDRIKPLVQATFKKGFTQNSMDVWFK